ELFRESVPGELARLDLTEAEARDADAAAAAALAEAERKTLEPAAGQPGSEAAAAAAAELETARRRAGDTAGWCRHVVEERDALLESERRSRSEIADLVQQARDVAGRIESVPRVSQTGQEPPGDTLAGVAEWARRVQTALFVVRGPLEAERDRL